MHGERVRLREWEDALPDSGFEVFHTPEALRVIDEYTGSELHLYLGYRGEKAVVGIPLFVHDHPAGRVVFSPPPSTGVQRLGPVWMTQRLGSTERERVHREFVRTLVADFDLDSPLTAFRAICGTGHADPRAYVWNQMRVDVRFTYILDVTRSADDVRASFSRSLRREIDDAEDVGVSVERGGDAGAERVYDDTVARYEEQGQPYRKSKEFVSSLLAALDDRARVYVARTSEGEYLGGVTVLYSNDVAYFWQGGTRTDDGGTSVNGLLHWRVIEDLIHDPPVDSLTGYDLVGANVERLCEYKAKFGGDLVPYYVVESSGPLMSAAKRGYKYLDRMGVRLPG